MFSTRLKLWEKLYHMHIINVCFIQTTVVIIVADIQIKFIKEVKMKYSQWRYMSTINTLDGVNYKSIVTLLF